MSSPLSPPAKATATTSLQSTTSSSGTTSPPVNSEPEISTLPLLFLAAQTGNLALLTSILEEQTGDVRETDEQGITALHWAAINNHLMCVKYLLERGAEVDAVGGDLSATPLMWAARNGHLYIVHLLLKHSADPTLLDSQSFNSLHLAVHSSSAILLAYLLFTSQPIAVDSSDTEGHTSLHWACYQGDAISVDLLLRAGADPRRADSAGLTPLHWAAVKGNAASIKRLIEAGAELSAKEKQGKTARDMATELKSLAAFQRGLVDAGCTDDGRKIVGTLSAKNTILAILAIPTLTFFLVLNTLAILPWWSGLLLAAAEFFGMHHVISNVLLDVKGPQNSDRITRSPYFSSIIIASIFWVSYVWVTRFVTATPGYAISNLFCGIFILVCAYNFFRAITLDPGHIPPASNDSELKEMIEVLVESGSFNGMNFCLVCMTRRPLRSKHSYATGRCTARFDHYCPWVWNDVGVNNHRQFLLFVLTLVAGILCFIRLAIAYFSENAPILPVDTVCILPTPLCSASHFDTLALATVFWAAIQLTWTSILVFAQLFQVCKQMTTLEVSNVGRYGYMGGKPGTSPTGQQGFIAKHSTGSTGATGAHVHGENCDHGPSKKSKSGKPNFLLKILGIDRFTSGKAAEGIVKSSTVVNPFDLGYIQNCNDFWSRGRQLGVDYTRIYEVPDGGFKRAVWDRKRREQEAKVSGKSGSAEGVRGSGNGYERLAMDEV